MKLAKLIILSLIFSASAQAAKLDFSDLTGALYLVDQQNGELQGMLKIDDEPATIAKASFQGSLQGRSLDCTGKPVFDRANQTLGVFLTCNETEIAKLTISLKQVKIADFLNHTFVSVKVVLHTRPDYRHGWTLAYLNQAIDLKKIH